LDHSNSGRTNVERLEILACILAAVFILMFLGTALARLTYPYELEWMEGAMVDGVVRLLEGKQIYVQPSIEYIPFIYPPVYFYLSAAVSLLTGPGFLPLRIVSLLSSLGTIYLIYIFAAKEAENRRTGIAAAGLFAASYAQVDAWFDISRVDPLALFLVIAAAVLIRFRKSFSAGIAAGLLLSLAFLTKQASLVAALPLILYWVLQRRVSIRWSLPLAFLLFSGVMLVLFNDASDGWFFYYTFSLPGQHPVLFKMLYVFWIDLLKPMAVAAVLSLLLMAVLWQNNQKEKAVFYLALLAGLIGSSYLGRLHPNAHINVLSPAYAGLAIAAPQGYKKLVSALKPDMEKTGRSASSKKLLFTIILLLQFVILAYNPVHYIPDGNDRAAGEDLMDTIQSYRGDVYLPYHGYLSTLAGKQSFAHAMAVSDVLTGTDEPAADALRQSMVDAFGEQQFEAMILDSDWMQTEWQGQYDCAPLLLPKDALWPRTGMQTRPDRICISIP